MMEEEEDWTQKDPNHQTVVVWMGRHEGDYLDAEQLARAAYEHFARPYHLDVLRKMARAFKSS